MINSRSSYNYYKSKADNPQDSKTYLRVISEFMTFIMDRVFEGYEVHLPARLGVFSIVGKKIRPKINSEGEIDNLAPDWVATKKLWESNPEARENKQLVYHFNEHSEGIRYKLLWSKLNVNVKNKSAYTFKLSRANKRKINSLISEGKEYLVLNRYKHETS